MSWGGRGNERNKERGFGEEGGASGDLKGLEASEGSQAQEAGGQADEKGSWVPAGTVSVIVPAGPGGNTDRSAQVFAQYASQITVLTGRPWVWIPPGICILMTILAVNAVGEGLRRAMDPREEGRHA